MRPTVHDLAAAAGVSLATVDRALNNRAGVSAKTKARVEEAVARIGFVRDVAAANLAKSRRYVFDFLVPDNDNSFMRLLRKAVEDAADVFAKERIEIRLCQVPAFNAVALATSMREAAASKPDGLAIVAVDEPEIRQLVDELAENGIPVVTLVSDLLGASRVHYAGIDNVAAGRTAASLLGRFIGPSVRGTVGALAGSMMALDHRRRLEGFKAVMGDEFPELSVLPVVEGHDNPVEAEGVANKLLRDNPDICGIYSLGGGNRGLLRALEVHPRGRRIPVIVHELTETSREALSAGIFDAVLNQDAGHEVRSAVRVLKASADGAEVLAGQERIRIDIYLRDNMPEAG